MAAGPKMTIRAGSKRFKLSRYPERLCGASGVSWGTARVSKMAKQDFAEAQIDALRVRLSEEFPDSEVWVGLRPYRREIEYRVNGHTGSCPVHRFPAAIEEIVDFVRAELR